MRESLDLPNLPEYVSIKDAAKLLGVSDKRVYAYIEDGRLQAVRAAHVIMIPLEEVNRFKPKIAGRPRKNTPTWRTSPDDNMLLTLSIFVNIWADQQDRFKQALDAIKPSGEHIFPGTVARYIMHSRTHPGRVEILLVWRSTAMPDEKARSQALNAFQHALADLLDWSSAHYDDGEVLLHT
jgi:excisionase family DNA binding protein